MKFNIKGIRFSTWLYFLGFSISILLILGFLLLVLIKPYYRNDRLSVIENISNSIEEIISSDNVNSSSINKTNKLVNGNNVCMLLLNEKGNDIFSLDSLGESCMIDKNVTINDETYIIKNNPEKFIQQLKENNPISLTLNSRRP